jgi:outer membrane lipopolysaccharide assembly protein LptE/RlpB
MTRIDGFRKRRGAAAALLAAGLVAALGGCGYRLRGTGSSLPPSIRTICVPVFKNQTTRYEIDVKLTQAVISELVARGKVRLVDDPAAADAVLEGEIIGFSATPIGFSSGNQADSYSITVMAKVTLRQREPPRPLFANPSFMYQQEYDVPQGASFESVQTEAIDKIADKFARSLIVSILEGF